MKKIIILFLCITSQNAIFAMKEKIKEDLEVIKKVVEEIIHIGMDMVDPELEEKIEGEQSAIAHNRYKDVEAKVTESKEICAEEQKFLKIRKPKVRLAFYKHLSCDIKNKKTPIVALCCSGGGYRAMLGALGIFNALEQTKLLKMITYMCGLSGSTWTINTWMSTQKSTPKPSLMPLHDFTEYIYSCIEKPLYEVTEEEACLIADMIAVKKRSKQPLTLVDLYGGLLGNRLLAHLKEKRHISHLSDQADIVSTGAYPEPIYTAVSGNESDQETSWYGLTPFDIMNITYGLSIPPYGLGRNYDKGVSTNSTPELPTSVAILGACGSAFAAGFDTIIEAAQDRDPQYKEILEELKKIVDHHGFGRKRAIPCELQIPNFTKGMETPLSKHDVLELVDAGTDFNLPYPSISGMCSGRKADIIIFCDMSEGAVGEQLQKCANWAHKNGTHFPPISLENIEKKTVSVFEGNTNDPMVIYMPGISDPELWKQHKKDSPFKGYNLSEFNLKKETEEGCCQTQHFQYLRKHAKNVVHQMKFNFLANQAVIIQAMQHKINSMPEKQK